MNDTRRYARNAVGQPGAASALQPLRSAAPAGARRLAWAALWACLLALLALTYLVQTGRAFRRWDWVLAQTAEKATDSYNHPGTIAFFRDLNSPVGLQITIAITLVAMGALSLRRAGWAVLLPLLLVATAVVEYLAKQIVHSPVPSPDIVMQPTLALAESMRVQAVQTICPLVLDVSKGTMVDPSCQGGSFLSGAAARLVIMAGLAIWWVLHRRWPWPSRVLIALALMAYVVAAGVGRVYLRWHWPSDVMGGYLVGGMCLCIMWLVVHARPAPQDRASP